MEIKDLILEYLKYAISVRSSDLFIFPINQGYQVKVRKDSGIEIVEQLDLEVGMQLINLLKFQAKMNVSEHRRPQVGSIKMRILDQEYYLRLSAIGNFDDYESLVVRIIYPLQETNYFFEDKFKGLEQSCQKRGLVITSGPTGSGKTSLMYEIARKVGKDKVVMCLEDPVEIFEDGFLQTQVNLSAGIDYQNLLKAALRHRPDVLIVGEIRDEHTAKLAVQASLSGHLVLTTIHARTSKGVVMRLLQLGISEVELENCLTAVTYQRLLPQRNGKYACLFDFGSDEELIESIKHPNQGFFSWTSQLEKLRERGNISEQIFTQFEKG